MSNNEIDSFLSGMDLNKKETKVEVAKEAQEKVYEAPTNLFDGITSEVIKNTKVDDFSEFPDGTYDAITQSLTIKTTSKGGVMATLTYKIPLEGKNDKGEDKKKLIFKPVFFPTDRNDEEFDDKLKKKIKELSLLINDIVKDEAKADKLAIDYLQEFGKTGKELKIEEGFNSTEGKLTIKTTKYKSKKTGNDESFTRYSFEPKA